MPFWTSVVPRYEDFKKGKLKLSLGDSSFNGYEHNPLFVNLGDGRFVDAGFVLGADSDQDGRGLVLADFDRNGTLDVLVNNHNQRPTYLVNRSKGNHWVGIDLKMPGRNRYAIGARVKVVAGGKTQTKELHSGTGFLASSPLQLHFGLGRSKRIDKIDIRWPNGDHQVVENVLPDRYLTIEYDPDSVTH